MADTSLIVRPPAALVRRHALLQQRLSESRHRLRDAITRARQSTRALTPTAQIGARHGIAMPTYGHAGDGNLHVNFLWNDPEEQPRVEAAIESLFREVVAMRGTLSGEHGIGVLKAPYLGLEQAPELIDFQRRIKHTFDPQGILNPGKIFTDAAGHRAC